MIKNTIKIVIGKIVPVVLAFAMLLNTQVQAFAQQSNFYVAAQDNTRVANRATNVLYKAYNQAALPAPVSYEEAKTIFAREDASHKLTEEDFHNLYNDYLKRVTRDDGQVTAVANSLKKEINIEGLLNYVSREGQKTGKVCQQNKCWDYQNYAQGFLRARLNDGAGINDSSDKFKWNAEIMLDAMPDIYGAYLTAGVHRADLQFLQKYLRFLVAKADDYCDNDTYLADIAPGAAGADGRGKAVRGKSIRQQQCGQMGTAMVLLGIAGESGKDKVQNAQVIYDAVKDTFKDDYGAITLASGVAGLLAVNTRGSYYLVEKLLTQDTVAAAQDFGTFGNGFRWFMDLLSVQAWVEKGTDINNRSRGRGGRYLDRVGAIFQYIDEDTAQQYGFSSFSIEVAKTNPSLGYNVPFGNVLEDIGVMIASSGTKEGHALAQRIVDTYAAALKADGNKSTRAHTPLVAGILQTGLVKNANAQFAAKKLNSLDWWDLNEATQRRVNNLAIKYAGTVKRGKNEAKVKRNETNQKIIQASVWTDMAVSAFFIMSLVVSLPAIVKNASAFASNLARIRAIKAAGKADLLAMTKIRLKALPVKAADVKISLAAKVAAKQKSAPKTPALPKAKNTTPAKINSVKEMPKIEVQMQYRLAPKQTSAPLAAESGDAVFTVSLGEGSGGSSARTGARLSSPETVTAQPIVSEIKVKPYNPKPYRPKVSVKNQRANVYAKRNIAERAIFGDKFYSELTPFKRKLMDLRLASDLSVGFTGGFLQYGLRNPKIYLGATIPLVPAAQAASLSSAPIAIVETVKAAPSAIKAVAAEGYGAGFEVLSKAASSAEALKTPAVPFTPRTSPFWGPGAIVAIDPQSRVSALSSGPFKSKMTAGGGGVIQTIKNAIYGDPNSPYAQGIMVLNKKRAFEHIRQTFKAKDQYAAFAAMAHQLEMQYPALKGDNIIYRGLFVSKEAELADIVKNGMDINRVVSKPIPVSTRDITDCHSEMSNMCFAQEAVSSMPYATGVNIFNHSRKGYMTMVVSYKPKDLVDHAIWYLSRSMRADEIADVLVYDVMAGKWVSVKYAEQAPKPSAEQSAPSASGGAASVKTETQVKQSDDKLPAAGKTKAAEKAETDGKETSSNYIQAPSMQVSLSVLKEYEGQIKEYYSLPESYLTGYFTARIEKYMAHPTFIATDNQFLYRGMFVTTEELKDILTNGMEISKTSWHTGAKKGSDGIISTSLSEPEARTYIYQSASPEKINKQGIGVVFKIRKTADHALFDDKVLNSTNTIYHDYKDIPASDIVGVSVEGPYGTEYLTTIKKNIESGRAKDIAWKEAFVRRSSFTR